MEQRELSDRLNFAPPPPPPILPPLQAVSSPSTSTSLSPLRSGGVGAARTTSRGGSSAPSASANTAAAAASMTTNHQAPIATKNAGPVEDTPGSPEFGPDGKRRRKRRPVTCAQCRKRKLKCDRGSPCGACRDRQEGHLCEWEGAVRLPNPAYTRDQEAQELRIQLDRLEGLINNLGGTEASSAVRPEFAAAKALGMLSSASNADSLDSRASDVGEASTDRFVRLLPDQRELDEAFDAFFLEDVPYIPVCHAPTFGARLRQFDDRFTREEPTLLATILAILGLHSHRLANDLNARSALAPARTLVDGAKGALELTNYTAEPSFDSLRTLLIVHYYELSQDTPQAPFLLGTIVRIAQDLGLNCDSGSYRLFDCIEMEERRRVWHYIISVDWITNGDRTYLCNPHQYDTRFPANAYDEDITPTTVGQRPFGASTRTLYISHLAQIASASRAITDRVFAAHTPLPVTWHAILQLNDELNRIEATFPNSFALEWKGEVVRPLDKPNAALDVMRVKLRLQLLRQYMRLNRPFLVRGCSDVRFKEGRSKCNWVAHQILALYRAYSADHKPAQTPDLTYHALNAVLVLAVDLYQDPEGQTADSNIRQLTSTLALFESRRIAPVSANLQREVIRVASYLLRRSSQTPELIRKRTFDGDSIPIGAAVGLPRRTPEQGLPTFPPILGGSPSHHGLDLPFTRSIPIPICLDPFSIRLSSRVGQELIGLWEGLKGWRGLYGLPDAREIEELAKIGTGSRPFGEGIDLVQK